MSLEVSYLMCGVSEQARDEGEKCRRNVPSSIIAYLKRALYWIESTHSQVVISLSPGSSLTESRFLENW